MRKVWRPSFRMSIGELSFESSSTLRVTWTIPDCFRLAEESGYLLRSPDFPFADGRHSLRLFKVQYEESDRIGIQLLHSTDADPVVLYEVQAKSRDGGRKGSRHPDYKNTFFFFQTLLERNRDECVPGGTLTVLCFVRRPTTPSRAGSPEPRGAQTRVIPERGKSSGELSLESFPFLYATWRIPRYLLLSWAYESTLESPEFPFSGGRYRLRLYSLEWNVTMQLVDLAGPVPGRCVPCDAGFKLTTGEDIYMKTWGDGSSTHFCIFRGVFHNRQSECFPDGHLTAFCRVRSTRPDSAGNPESGGAESRVVAGSKSVAVQTSNEEEDREALPGGLAKLQSDYKRLLLKGAESDSCLVVGGKEFQAHKCVLRARSPVFEAMFDHETTEKASGRVVIDDLSPDRFEDFLEYVYTGGVESFCDDNAFGLYAAADKYDVPILKSECVEYMRTGLSVDNFCDVLTLALRHRERDLLQLAVEFFKKNVAGIILTVKWQQFMSENSTRANELLVKLLVPGRESDDVLLP